MHCFKLLYHELQAMNVQMRIITDDNVDKLTNQYDDVNQLLSKELSLEESLFFMDLPHKKYLFNLQQTSKKQKKIVRHIGRHFVSLVKENKFKKNSKRKQK